MLSAIIPICWLLHLILCFYFIQKLSKVLHRILLTLIPCSILIFIGCYDLPYFHMSSIITISLYWMFTIRLLQLIILTPNEVNSFYVYASKFLWLLIPVIPCQSKNSIGFYIISACIKMLLNHWIFHWLRSCEPNDSYGRLIMFFISICTGTFVNDIQIIIIRLITFNKYTLLDFNDNPYLSKSVREFWGRRYNRLVSTLLKEAVFDPLRRLPQCSPTIAAFTSFIISGLLHAHVAMSGFGASPFPAFLFFILSGLVCCLETKVPFTLPKPFAILLTQTFLLITGPLYAGLFSRAPLQFYELNKPLLVDSPWVPKLPVPKYCPK